jgi:nicotinate phosphoribosyltransferase
VFREHDAHGAMTGDCIALANEEMAGAPLLREVMRDGRRVGEVPALAAIREYCRGQVAELPVALRALDASESSYRVRVSPGLEALAARMDAAAD